ncbi:hypothetical protein KH5H1_32610 [Corallococcus caeni]|uniref:hypothetical protein n=1 Tax=Corallococcus caeni TaxID=3082388 RepID=UPI002956FC8F|nr:hypothetical protein KH5H1_32610 [Corallococcus sp. KH5-1]
MPTASIKVIPDNNLRLEIDGQVYCFNPMTEEEVREEAEADTIFILEGGALTQKHDPAQLSGEAYELENGIKLLQKPSAEIWCSRSFKQHLEQRIDDARAGRCRFPGQKEFYSSLAGKIHWLHPQHMIVREGVTLRLLEFTQQPLFPAQKSGVLITVGEKNLLVANGSACNADYTTSAVPRLEMLILDADVPKEQATPLVDFIRFLSPRRLFLKPQSVRKKLHTELLEQLKSRAPEIEVVSQKKFQLSLLPG